MLTAQESPDDYREVTDSEKAKLEAADAAWVRPEQWVIDMFNSDPNGRYNEETGYGELNGLVDLTAEDMKEICRWDNKAIVKAFTIANANDSKMRTNLTFVNGGYSFSMDASSLFNGQRKIEVVNICPYRSGGLVHETQWLTATFNSCNALRKVIGTLIVSNATGGVHANAFTACQSLEEVHVKGLKGDISFSQCPKLSLESLQFLLANAEHTKPITITVHPDVYAKLTDGQDEQWHQLVADAEAKQITFATT